MDVTKHLGSNTADRTVGQPELRVSRAEAEQAEADFSGFIRDASFPCVGAKAAEAHNCLTFYHGWSLRSGWDDVALQDELSRFAASYRRDPALYRSFVALFHEGGLDGEAEYERFLWERLQSLSDKDAWRSYPFDESVEPDPVSPHFSLSFGGLAFFVVGMHPGASRPARRFQLPAIVFNIHDQFEQLRTSGLYETMRKKILDRDQSLAGSVNPMLARHGESSEARQYSGRIVSDEWEAPFRNPRAK